MAALLTHRLATNFATAEVFSNGEEKDSPTSCNALRGHCRMLVESLASRSLLHPSRTKRFVCKKSFRSLCLTLNLRREASHVRKVFQRVHAILTPAETSVEDDDSVSIYMAGEGFFSLRRCECHDLADTLVPYTEAWAWQKEAVEARRAAIDAGEPYSDTVLLLQHPPVYTLGTRSSLDHLLFDTANPPAELHQTERGGEVTYHGPGQLVVYPILDLRHQQMDLHWYLRALEEVAIRTLQTACNIKAGRMEGFTGVWAEGQKVAAIGVRVSRWITYHGIALNINTDLKPYEKIVPCGLTLPVGSVKELLLLRQGGSGEAGPSKNIRDWPHSPEDLAMGVENERDQALLKLVSQHFLAHLSVVFKLDLVSPTVKGPV
eukprot:jgi/Mesen1/7076/ME000369S06401